MNRAPDGRPARSGPPAPKNVPARPRASRTPAVALKAGLTAGLASGLTAALLALASPALAEGGPAVRLPVLPAEPAAGSVCTGRSATTATDTPWEHLSLELPRAARISEGAGVTVGVVDTGVSTEAPALAGRVQAIGPAGDDCVGHGTFVAGLIAAAPAGGTAFHGVAPRARIVAARGTTERGAPTPASVAAGIRGAVDAGARVVTVAAALTDRSSALDAAVAYAARHDVLLVAAAVPDAPRTTTVRTPPPPPRDYWPAAAPGVLGVLDVDVRGGRPDGARLPAHADLAAPGDAVVGIGPRGAGHFVGSGASLAAGYAAGAAALVRSAHPDLSAAETARRLTSTAYPDDVPRLDVYAAVASVAGDTGAAGGGLGAHAGAVRLPDRSHGERATRTAVLVSAAGAGVVLLAGWAALAVPRGRARGWRPARR
ncbi:S8 family serine peptidase [Streptomyces sp. NPDC048718]|uniref:S8 family serine peptidase n=1 Tax=Streptomyces sp. NPDC048718 TaxID=3365587 RepID=UPI0037153086